ncbi:MAG TPA: hypothetical protein DEA43_04635 [Candidatus Moranbacteria bacterium]|nr:hypothetical protein [Candidatus Moranbacteria bacterium]HBT46140.1 hypothetical protein [Candidatus Moranbacteria bacterium]
MENYLIKKESDDEKVLENSSVILQVQEKNIKNIKIVVVAVLVFVLVFIGLFLYYFPHFQESDNTITTKNSKNVNNDINTDYIDNGNISFNTKNVKLLDLNGYEQKWSENFLPAFSQYGNWILAPVIKDGKNVMLLGLRNGQTKEFGLNVAVSPNFKELAYETAGVDGSKIVIESLDDGQKKWESSVFKEIFNLHFGTETNLLNIIGIQDGKTVWYVDGQKKAEFDQIKYLTSDTAKMSKDKTRLAIIGLKDKKPVLVVNGEERIFENAQGINLVGFSEVGNHVSYGLIYSKEDAGLYSDDKEIARNIYCNMTWAVISPTGDKIACPPTGTGAPGNQYVKVFGEESKVFRKAYYEASFPSFSLDGKELAYVVNTGKTQDVRITKWMAVVNEKEEKQYDEVRPVVWGGNNTYAYVAQELSGKGIETVETNFVVINGIEQHKFSGKMSGGASRIEPYQLTVNPVNGKVGYVVCNADVTTDESLKSDDYLANTITNIEHRCFVIYDGKTQPEFGLISDKLQFTPDGEHIFYTAGERGDNFARSGIKQLILDGKKVNINGAVWQDLYFSPDGKKIGMYVMKDKEYWWQVYDIEDLLSKAEVLPNKDLEAVRADTWNDINDKKVEISIPDGWKKYTDKNFEIYYPADYKEQFENKSFKISSKSSIYEKTSGVNMLKTGIEISNSEMNNYTVVPPKNPTFEQWKSKKNEYLRYSISKWPSDDFKTELSSGFYNGHDAPVTTMRWTSGSGSCFSKDVYLYNPKKYIDVGFRMKTCGDSEKEVQTFEKILATFKFAE